MAKIDIDKFICSLLSGPINTGDKIYIESVLSEQNLYFIESTKELVSTKPLVPEEEDSEYDPYNLPVWDESNLPRMDESKYHPCTKKKDKPETEEMAYFKKAVADIVDYSRKHPDITPDGFVDRFMEHFLDIANLALKPELDESYKSGYMQAIDNARKYIELLLPSVFDSMMNRYKEK